HRQGGDCLGRIRRKRLARIFLALQIGNHSVVQKQIGNRDPFRLFSSRAIAKVEDELFRPLLLQVFNLVCNVLRLALVQRVHLQIADSVVQKLVRHRRNSNRLQGEHRFLRLRLARPHQFHIDRGAGASRKQTADFRHRHVVRALAAYAFDDVSVLQSNLVRWAAGNDRDDHRISKALGNRGANVRLRSRLLALLVLLRGQVARIGVERLQQSVQRAIGDRRNVRVLNVLAFHTRKHFAVNLNLRISAVFVGGAYTIKAPYNGENQDGGGDN